MFRLLLSNVLLISHRALTRVGGSDQNSNYTLPQKPVPASNNYCHPDCEIPVPPGCLDGLDTDC